MSHYYLLNVSIWHVNGCFCHWMLTFYALIVAHSAALSYVLRRCMTIDHFRTHINDLRMSRIHIAIPYIIFKQFIWHFLFFSDSLGFETRIFHTSRSSTWRVSRSEPSIQTRLRWWNRSILYATRYLLLYHCLLEHACFALLVLKVYISTVLENFYF